MYNLDWKRFGDNRQKLGTFGEYYAKMALASYGMSIYTSEVDDHGIDFVAEVNDDFLKFQVKTIRKGTGYVLLKEKYFKISDSKLYLLLLVLVDGEHSAVYMIPTSAWENKEKTIFVHRPNYSEPEYGINISAKNMDQLEEFKLEKMIDKIV